MRTKLRRHGLQVFTAVFIGSLLASSFAWAEEASDDAVARAQALRDRQAKQANQLVDRLSLSRSQARKLLPPAEEAAALYVAAYEQEAQLLPEMLEAFATFAREDRLSQGFTPEVERRTARLNHRARLIREHLDEQLTKLEEQAGKILTASQRQRLEAPPREQRPVGNRIWRTDTRSRRRAAERQRLEARRQPLREARQELSELHRETHPRPGPVGRLLLHPFGAERLGRIAHVRTPELIVEAMEVLKHGTSEYSLNLVAQQKVELLQLRAEINNWNLINGLHLSEQQIEQIVSLYEQAAAPTWQMVRRDPRTGLSHQALVKLEREVAQVLNTGQHQVLAEYQACLIPPKNLKDPVRVGQASDNSHYERWLERARKLPAQRLAKHIDAALKKEADHFGELSRAERQKRVALLRRTVRQAGQMSDTEFESSKAESAEKIAAPDRAQAIRDRIATLARQLGEPGTIAHFMLNPRFIEQLRVRGRQLAEGVTTEQVDLAAGPQAENCDDTCAIDGPRSGATKVKNE